MLTFKFPTETKCTKFPNSGLTVNETVKSAKLVNTCDARSKILVYPIYIFINHLAPVD